MAKSTDVARKAIKEEREHRNISEETKITVIVKILELLIKALTHTKEKYENRKNKDIRPYDDMPKVAKDLVRKADDLIRSCEFLTPETVDRLGINDDTNEKAPGNFVASCTCPAEVVCMIQDIADLWAKNDPWDV